MKATRTYDGAIIWTQCHGGWQGIVLGDGVVFMIRHPGPGAYELLQRGRVAMRRVSWFGSRERAAQVAEIIAVMAP